MLGFNEKVKTLSELEARIEVGWFDEDIKEHLFSILRDEKIEYHPADLFELTVDLKDEDRCIYLYSGDSHRSSLSRKEILILEKFKDRIKSIYDSISEDDIRDKYSRMVNAKELLSDVKEYGMPEIHFYSFGTHLNGKIEKIDIVDNYVVLTSGEMKTDVTILNDNLRISLGGRPSNLFVKCVKCYDVMDDYMKHTGFYIYWRKED